MTTRTRRPPPLDLLKKPLPAPPMSRPPSSIYSFDEQTYGNQNSYIPQIPRKLSTPVAAPGIGAQEMAQLYAQSSVPYSDNKLTNSRPALETSQGRTRSKEDMSQSNKDLANRAKRLHAKSQPNLRPRPASPDLSAKIHALLSPADESFASTPSTECDDISMDETRNTLLSTIDLECNTLPDDVPAPLFTPNFSRIGMTRMSDAMKLAHQVQKDQNMREQMEQQQRLADSLEEERRRNRKPSVGKVQTLLGMGMNFPVPPMPRKESTVASKDSKWSWNILVPGKKSDSTKMGTTQPINVPSVLEMPPTPRISDPPMLSNHSSLGSSSSGSASFSKNMNYFRHSPMSSDASSAIGSAIDMYTPVSGSNSPGPMMTGFSDDLHMDAFSVIDSYYASEFCDSDGQSHPSEDYLQELDTMTQSKSAVYQPQAIEDDYQMHYTTSSNNSAYTPREFSKQEELAGVPHGFDFGSYTGLPTPEVIPEGTYSKRLVEEMQRKKSTPSDAEIRNLKELQDFGFSFAEKMFDSKQSGTVAPKKTRSKSTTSAFEKGASLSDRDHIKPVDSKDLWFELPSEFKDPELMEEARYKNLERLAHLPHMSRKSLAELDSFPTPPQYLPAIPPRITSLLDPALLKEAQEGEIVPLEPILSSRWSAYSSDDDEKDKKSWRKSKSHVRNMSSVSSGKHESRVETLKKGFFSTGPKSAFKKGKKNTRPPIPSSTFGGGAGTRTSQATPPMDVSPLASADNRFSIESDAESQSTRPHDSYGMITPLSPAPMRTSFNMAPPPLPNTDPLILDNNNTSASGSDARGSRTLNRSGSLANIGDFVKTPTKGHKLRASKSTIDGWNLKSSSSMKNLKAVPVTTAAPSATRKSGSAQYGLWI